MQNKSNSLHTFKVWLSVQTKKVGTNCLIIKCFMYENFLYFNK